MNGYRCQFLDRAGGLCHDRAILALSMHDALGVAMTHLEATPDAVAVEIWSGERLMGYLPKLALVEAQEPAGSSYGLTDSPELAPAV
jgi:hypothetical protein